MTQEFKLNLQMFNGDGGAGAAPAGDAGTGAGAAEIAPGVLEDGTEVDARLAARMKEQEARRAARGKTPLYNARPAAPEAEQQAEEPQAEAADPAKEREARWSELKKGEMKELYGRDVQEAIQKRLKNQHDAQAQLDSLTPMLNVLARQRGIPEGDMDALRKSIESDDSLIEDQAAEAGMTVEAYRMMQDIQRENERYRAQEAANVEEQRLFQHYQKLAGQADQLKQQFPDFDLQAELQNENFLRMTSPEGGLSVEEAFWAIHHRELGPQAMAYGIQRAQQQMSMTLQANRQRPTEGALNGSKPAASLERDPRRMTKAERAELIRRARMGEEIVL